MYVHFFLIVPHWLADIPIVGNLWKRKAMYARLNPFNLPCPTAFLFLCIQLQVIFQSEQDTKSLSTPGLSGGSPSLEGASGGGLQCEGQQVRCQPSYTRLVKLLQSADCFLSVFNILCVSDFVVQSLMFPNKRVSGKELEYIPLLDNAIL